MNTIEFTVPGEPQQWKRALSNGGRRYTHPKCTTYRERVQVYARAAMKGRQPLDCACGLFVTVVESAPKLPPKDSRLWINSGGCEVSVLTPDEDNYIKMLSDAVQGVIITDDKRFSFMGGIKLRGRDPHCIVTVWPLAKIHWTEKSVAEFAEAIRNAMQ